jgi:hypothetical protein
LRLEQAIALYERVEHRGDVDLLLEEVELPTCSVANSTGAGSGRHQPTVAPC